MAVKDFPVSDTKVKLRYRERYITEGSNEKSLALARGCYRGFMPRKSALANKSIWLDIDPKGLTLDEDSFAIYAERSSVTGDGWALSVRETTAVELDLTGVAGIDVNPAGFSWLYVYILADYTVGSVTNVTYSVSTVNPMAANPDAIVIGRVPIDPLVNFIVDFDITNAATYATVVAPRKYPSPTSVEDDLSLVAGDDRWGYFDSVSKWRTPTGDQKWAMTMANVPSAVNPFATENDTTNMVLPEPWREDISVDPTLVAQKITLSGWWFVGKGASGVEIAKYFRIGNHWSSTKLEWESAQFEDDGGGIRIRDIWDTAGAFILNPGADADGEGFYNNPTVRVDVFTTQTNAQDFSVYGSRKSTLESLDQAPIRAPSKMVPPHAIDVGVQNQTSPPLWVPTSQAVDDEQNLQDVVTQHHQRLRGTNPEDMTDEELSSLLYTTAKCDAHPFSSKNQHYIEDAGFNPYLIHKVLPWRRNGVLSLVMILRDTSGPTITLDMIGVYNPDTKALTTYDYASLYFPAPTGVWEYDDIAVDDDSIYVRATDTVAYNTGAGSRVVKVTDGTAADPSWDVAGDSSKAIGPSANPDNSLKTNRVIVADDTHIAVNVSGTALFGAAPATVVVVVLSKSNGAITGGGSGDSTVIGTSYHIPTDPTYVWGPMVSDGTNIYFSTYDDHLASPAMEASKIYQCKISAPSTSTVAGWGSIYALGGRAKSLIYDGYYIWGMSQGDLGSLLGADGEISVTMQSPNVVAPMVAKLFDASGYYVTSHIGGACFDGKNIWTLIYDSDAGSNSYAGFITKIGPQGVDSYWPNPMAVSQDLADIVRDRFNGGTRALAANPLVNIFADPAFDGEDIWYAPEQNNATASGYLFRIPNIKDV